MVFTCNVKYLNNNSMEYPPIHRCWLRVNIYCWNFCSLPWTAFLIFLTNIPHTSNFNLWKSLANHFRWRNLTPSVDRQHDFQTAILEAWISSDYSESLSLTGENDSKQSDEFQATILVLFFSHWYCKNFRKLLSVIFILLSLFYIDWTTQALRWNLRK